MPEPRSIYPKHFMIGTTPPRRSGFILMPFRSEFDDVHSAIRDAIQHAGLEPERADDEFSTRAGMEKILRGIAEAEVVVADMTGRNANVFYEVGIAHTVKDNVVLLAQDINDLPFDLQHIDHIVYESSTDGLTALTTRLQDIIGRLPAEPHEQTLQVTAPPSGQADVRRRLTPLLAQVLSAWPEKIRTLEPVAKLEIGPQIATSQVQKTAERFLKEFTGVWQPVDELAFEAIGTGDTNIFIPMTRALETAFSVQAKAAGGVRIVYGQPSLLAFRSWSLWGALAIDQRAFGIVQTLLRTAVRVAGNPGQVIPLPSYGYLVHPEATLNDCEVATQIVIGSGASFAEQFGGLDAYQEALALFFFGAQLASAHQLGDSADPMFPIWTFLPTAAMETAVTRLERDADFASQFAHASTGLSVDALNEIWAGTIREKLRQFGMQGLTRRYRIPQLPTRFASS